MGCYHTVTHLCIRVGKFLCAQTIFYILPLLCNVSPDELIPSSHFQGTLASCNSDWDHLCDVALASCNAALNKACEEHLNAHATAKDGSDTRSIAHRVSISLIINMICFVFSLCCHVGIIIIIVIIIIIIIHDNLSCKPCLLGVEG